MHRLVTEARTFLELGPWIEAKTVRSTYCNPFLSPGSQTPTITP